MPTFIIDIPDTHSTIVRPVSLKIIDDLKQMTGIPADTAIQYTGGAISPTQVGSTLQSAGSATNTFATRDVWRIEVTETDVEGQVLPTAVKQHDQRPIFLDDKLNVFLRPVYSETELAISVTARFSSRVSAEKWRSSIRTRVSMGRVETNHEITYNYRIPDEALYLLYALHDYRERNAGYGEDLRTWVRNHMDKRYTGLVNQAGENPMATIPETQIQVIGWFDFDITPSSLTKDQQNGTWEASFEYRVRYKKVISLVIGYPIMIHNQLLPDDLVHKGVPYQIEQYTRFASLTQEAYVNVEDKHLPIVRDGIGGVSIPIYDDWFPALKSPTTTILMRILIVIDPENPQDILNLRDLGEYAIDNDILDYIAKDPSGLTMDGGSALRLTLYNSRYPMSRNILSVDNDLNVRATEPLSERLMYHLCISITNDLMSLTDKAKDLLRRHATACLKTFLALDKDLARKGLLPKPIGNDMISKSQFTKTAAYLNERFTINYPRQNKHWVTVSHIAIVAKRED